MTSTEGTAVSSGAASGAEGANEKLGTDTGHNHTTKQATEPGSSDTQPSSVRETDPSSGDSITPGKELEHQPDGQTSESPAAAAPSAEVANRDPKPAAGTGTGMAEAERTKLQTTLIILSLASALFLSALDVTIVTVAIPTITQQFNSTAGYTWIGSAYMLATAASAPMWGKFSDIWGRKPVILVATGVFWVGSLLAALSVNMSMLITARAVQGVGGGGIVILVYICISDLFSMRTRGEF